MSLTRRDFIKLFGMSVASLLLTRCRVPVVTTCYAPLPPPTDVPSGLERLRSLWLRFDELAQSTTADYQKAETLSQQLSADHRAALDLLVANGQLTAPVADLVQEAYAAALYHVWRSNAPITCYEPVQVDYAPVSAGILVEQAEALSEVSGQIDPATLSKAQAALEHDLAFYALGDEDVQALYNRLIAEAQQGGQGIPAFEALDLEPTPEARAAAQFIVSLLTNP